MLKSFVQRSWIVFLFMALGPVPSAQAQLSDLDVRLYAGVISPAGTFADYFEFGPNVGLTIVHPVSERAGLFLDVGWVRLGHRQHTYVPYTNVLHYQVGAEVDVIGSSVLSLRPYASVGASSFSSDDFAVVGRVENWESLPWNFSHTYLSGTGGLRLVLEPGDGLTWFVNGEYSWSPIGEADAEVLQRVSNEPLELLSAATNMALTAGFSFRTR